MLFPEEETVSSVIEQGSFYTPIPQAKENDRSVLHKAMFMVIPGAVLALILPLLLPSFTLTHFLASLLLVTGFFTLLYEDPWFHLGFVLSVIQLVYGIWRFVSANLLPMLQAPHTLRLWITVLALILQVGILICYWIGMKRCKITQQ